MSKKSIKRYRVSPTFTSEEYDKIANIAHRENKSMSEISRNWIIQGMNGTLTEDNLDYIAPIIREQLKGILTPQIERLASLSAKTCVQAGTAAYLSANAILKFVPENQREDFMKTYEAARKRAVEYTRNRADIEAD